MRILMIEDQRDNIEGIIDFCSDEKYDCKVKNFEEGVSYIERYNPDIIILDLKNNIDERFEGCDILDKVWEKSFRPVCVFSGQINESTIEKAKFNSPLIKFIDKGDETPVKEYIKRIAPYVDCISAVKEKTNEAMRHAFDFFDLAIDDNITNANVMSKLCGDRIKAYFDNENNDIDMPAWSQYVYPVLNEDFLNGDIIKLKGANNGIDHAENYFVILSQSCDICHKNISEVLVAHGETIEKLVSKGRTSQKQKAKCVKILNTGYEGQYFPLPGLSMQMPDLVIDLKKISLIKIDQINESYEKVASLTSPYKERLMWAYMHNACRPGVPDLAVEKWLEKLCAQNDEAN